MESRDVTVTVTILVFGHHGVNDTSETPPMIVSADAQGDSVCIPTCVRRDDGKESRMSRVLPEEASVARYLQFLA